MKSTDLTGEIKSILHGNLIAGGFSAAISSRHTDLLELQVGHANIVKNEPVNRAHLFGIGSITKVFVAVVIFQLIEEQKLKLTDTAGQYISSEVLHDIDNAEAATIQQLLSHTAGIDSWENDPKWIVDGRGANIDLARIWGKGDTLEYLRRPKIAAPDPADWYYSNTNYTILGLIIERITQNTAEAEIRRRILVPLDMTETFFDEFEECPASGTVTCRYHYATAQFRETAGVPTAFASVLPDIIEATGSNLSVSWAAGGMISSASDLIKFGLALRDGQLLEPSSMQVLQKWSPTSMDGHEMGHGLFRVTLPGKGSWMGHSGGVLGFSSALWWKEGEDCVTSVLSNVGTVHAGKVPFGVSGVVRESDFLNIVPQAVHQNGPSPTLPRAIDTNRLRIYLADPKDDNR